MARMIPLHSASSQAEIERRAQELFEQAGRPPGRDLDHWLQAEADHRERLPFFSAGCDPVLNGDGSAPAG